MEQYAVKKERPAELKTLKLSRGESRPNQRRMKRVSSAIVVSKTHSISAPNDIQAKIDQAWEAAQNYEVDDSVIEL